MFPFLTLIVVLPIFVGSLIFFLPYRGNREIRCYTICISILELLLTTYAFCYHFQLDDSLIQLIEDSKWIHFFNFHWRLGINGLSIGPILLNFIDGIHHYFSYFSGLASYSGFSIISFPDISNVQWANRIILLSGPFTFFLHVRVRINSYLSTCIYVGRKKRLYSAKKFILYTEGGFVFLLMGVLAVGLYGSSEPTFHFEILVNGCYPATLEIIFYIGFFIAFVVKLPIIPLHTRLPDIHGEANYSTCILLARSLFKMGAYGLVRINMELFPHAHSLFYPWLIINK
uniref:NADH-plastoquinone oxidoreductase subunit 4 n=1 Tax=Cymbaria daurica TaxID=2867398 RepID=UPI0020375EDE|nr:NADH-plastoquinone oxidoreductase subunit 4 [Cymbaria daurica]URC16258.1 NADH-plastoquinone oxidoreductase subunit 4 [Cymbaria daurica]